MKIRIRYILLALLIVGIIMNWMQESYNEALTLCLEKHSMDTCFYSLNH